MEVPGLEGKVYLVTGANSGIGLGAVKQLAEAGAHVIMGCRNIEKAQAARDRVTKEVSGCSLELLQIDLASFASVRSAAGVVVDGHDRLDGLINNAGVMALPYCTTEDGLEMQIGVNHFGHFLLTLSLLDLLGRSAGARVVTVSSVMHRIGKMRWEGFDTDQGYHKWLAYGQSKLANLLFCYELDRRLKGRGLDVVSVACHPGYASTNLTFVGPEMEGARFMAGINSLGSAILAQSAEAGAWPTVHAATDPSVRGGHYFGPAGFLELRGRPKKVGSNASSRSVEDAKRLWKISESLTGLSF
jgi:NAD(P)-dependent dehydrogenase (short-subunit alcohol dehydrogenase family)